MSGKPDYPEFLFPDFPPDPPRKKAPARTVNADAGNRNQKCVNATRKRSSAQPESPRKERGKSETGRAGRKNPSEILTRLEVDAVLLAIRRGTKRPNRKGWQKLSFADTQELNYQRSLNNAPAIGVLLGGVSGGLCSIDFDDDDYLERFLKMNPKLAGTLRTTARRGANLWIILEDTPPPSRKLAFEGKAVGEFRADKNQTLIAGLHPEGFRYRRLVDASPVRLCYSAIHWPEGTEGPLPHPAPPHSSQSSESSPSLNALNPLHNIRERQEAKKQAEADLEANPPLFKLFRRFIAKRFTPRQGNRNSDLVAMVTFLHKAVSQSRVRELLEMFHRVNQDVFLDPLEQHMNETKSHLAACDISWKATLNPAEADAAGFLSGSHLEAFRICRDLARHPDESLPPNHFYLSCNDLGDRLALHPPEAQRMLLIFESAGVIAVTEKGTRHAKGQAGRATRYEWLLNES